jgi:uncharacterized protein
MTVIDVSEDAQTPSRTELVWDLPNFNGTLQELIGPDAVRKHRADFSALASFLVHAARDATLARGTIFMNIPSTDPSRVEGFVTKLRRSGFAVFVKPRTDSSDIDDNLVALVAQNRSKVSRLIIGTHDRDLLDRCVKTIPTSCAVTVIGFEECSRWAIQTDRVRFVDVEDVPGLFTSPLPRCLLRRIQPEGALLAPLGPLPDPIRVAA